MVNFLVKLFWRDRIDQFSRTNFDDTKQVMLLSYFYYYFKFLNVSVQKFKQLYRQLGDNNLLKNAKFIHKITGYLR